MPLSGTYEPSPQDYVRKQVEVYESTGGAEGNTMRGKPVIILTSRGVKSGKIRKTPLMRVEHDGLYAVVASQGGAPERTETSSGSSASPSRRPIASSRAARCWLTSSLISAGSSPLSR